MGTKKRKGKKGRPVAAAKHKLNDKLKFTGKILKKEGQSVVIKNLTQEDGVVRKVDGDHVYLQTVHGTHYLHQDKVKV